MIKLIKNKHYRDLTNGKIIRYSHTGGTGLEIFYSHCEHSFQDCLAFVGGHEGKIAEISAVEQANALLKDTFLVEILSKGS